MEEDMGVPAIDVDESVTLTADGGNVASNVAVDEIVSKERDKRYG